MRFVVTFMIGAAATLTVATPAHATAMTYTRIATWSTGYTAEITVTNNFSFAISGWEVGFDLPSTTTIQSLWNSRVGSTTPHYVIVNATYNGTLNPGASTTFGFVALGLDDPVFLWP